MLPVPLTMNVWPQFRSPLMWDVFAVSTYATISVVFWYIGMVPDFGTMRDRADSKFAKYAYGLVSLGWRGSVRHWMRYETASLLLAGLATPLVLSVHTVISFDFAVAVLPGWHTTIFPPYFVAGAIYSGFAMVLTLAIPLRKFYHLEGLVTERHIDNMGKVMLATGFIVAYGYAMEVFMAWYSASHWEAFMMWNRMFGPMGWAYWVLVTCNLAIPLTTLWSRKLRTNIAFMFFISIVVNTGMWFERFVIVVTSLYRDFLPSSWGTYRATKWDYMTYVGTLGLFTALFLLFVRFLPMIPMSKFARCCRGRRLRPRRPRRLVTDGPTPRNLRPAGRIRYAGRPDPRRATGAPGRLAAHGLLHALSRRRGGRGYRLSSQQGAADDADRRIDGPGGDVFLEVWVSVWAYPLNIAGVRRIHGRPSLCPPTSGRFCLRDCRRPSECWR
jgi:Ni/Fe-hydrogenase subunit HybB-like protein